MMLAGINKADKRSYRAAPLWNHDLGQAPRDRWIVAAEALPSSWRNRSDLPPVVVHWDGTFWVDRDDHTWNIYKWADCPQPESWSPSPP
jgi:hypothetical protein